MNIFERVIRALLYLCALALCFFLILWVLGAIGIALPAMVITILKVMFVLIAILVLVRLFYPVFQGLSLWGDPK
jgi:hypothetical protein